MDSQKDNSAPDQTPANAAEVSSVPTTDYRVKLPIKEPVNSKKRLLIIVSIVAALLLVGAVAAYMLFMKPADTPVATAPTPTPTKTPEQKAIKDCVLAKIDKCTVTKNEYVLAAKHVYLPKDGTIKDTDPKTKQDITKISTYLDTEYPDANFVLMTSYDNSTNTSKGTAYRSFEYVNGAVVEFDGLVPQITVSGSTVAIDLSDESASLSTKAQRDKIVTDKALTEAKLIEVLDKKIATLTDKEMKDLYGSSSNKAVAVTYGLYWSDRDGGLVYRILLNSSTVVVNANTGAILEAQWSDGIIN